MSAQHNAQPVLTIIAGPNGSGKTTFVSNLVHFGKIGVLVNADQISASLAIRRHEEKPSLETQFDAAKAAEEMRWALLSQRISFSTETVMSDKTRWIELISQAKTSGYRVILYFITTEDPSINIERVTERVSAGGHAVDASKIVSRYHRVMKEVLPLVLTMIDEAVLFDNSSANRGAIGVVSLQQGQLTALLEVDQLPEWASKIQLTFLQKIGG